MYGKLVMQVKICIDHLHHTATFLSKHLFCCFQDVAVILIFPPTCLALFLLGGHQFLCCQKTISEKDRYIVMFMLICFIPVSQC